MTQPEKVKHQSDARERLIIALDVATAADASRAIDELRDSVGAFKIGLQLFTAAGPGFVKEVVESGAKLFLDLKFHDIPNTVAAAAVEAARLGVWMFNVHALGGSEMMRRTAESVADACSRGNLPKPHILGVTVLTSSDVYDLRELGIGLEPVELVRKLAQQAHSSRLDGVVASAHEISHVREAVDDDNFLIVAPGIRPTGATVHDQKRVMTAGEAVAAGADYLVVGRPVMESNDRALAVENLANEIRNAY